MRPLFCQNKAHIRDEGILRFCQNRVRVEEVGDVVEAVVEEEVDAEDVVEADVDEAPTRACQTRGHVGDEGTPGVASTVHAGAGTTVNHTPASEGLAEEDLTAIAAPISRG